MKSIEVPIDTYYKMMDAYKEMSRLSEFLLVNYPHQIKGNFQEENPVSVAIRLLNR